MLNILFVLRELCILCGQWDICREYVQDFCAHYKTYSIMLLFLIIMKVYSNRYILMESVIISIIHLM